MRIWALVAILGLSGCSAMGTALFGPAPAADPAAEQEAQTAASAAAPEQRKPRKVNPITGQIDKMPGGWGGVTAPAPFW